MKRILLSVVLATLISGCALDQDEIEFTTNSCLKQNGVVSYVTTQDGTIYQVNCIVGNIRYRMGNVTGKFLEGRVVQ
jgi:hypothetical protein